MEPLAISKNSLDAMPKEWNLSFPISAIHFQHIKRQGELRNAQNAP
jgi:hypothetical protein